MRVITADQGTPEWLAARVGVPSGSRYSDVMASGKGGAPSVTRQSYLTSIALEIVTGVREEMPVSGPMAHGTLHEPDARSMYETRIGELVDEIGFCLHDSIKTGVSPDGLVGKAGLIEIKCPQPKTHLEYLKRKDEPPAYKWQIQGQLWVMERDWCDFVSYSPSFPDASKLAVRRVYRDEAAIKSLETEIVRFLEEVEQEVEFIRSYKEAA